MGYLVIFKPIEDFTGSILLFLYLIPYWVSITMFVKKCPSEIAIHNIYITHF